MHSSLLLPSLSFLSSVAWAGQYPLHLPLQENFCTSETKNSTTALLPAILQLEHEHTDDHNHHDVLETPSTFGQWTHERKCIDDEKTDEIYCVYTNTSFANGRGISFFTTPAIASHVVTLPAFTEAGVHDNANTFHNPPWEVRNIPGRGNGLYATRLLRRGDLILTDTPVGIYQSDAFFPDYEIGYKFIRRAFEQLPKGSREGFMNMAQHNQGDFVMERINTNAFAGELEGHAHFMVYPETALMNHDCRPNAMYYHNPNTLVHSTHASRTIQPGEEITITYINLLQSQAERQEMLTSIWGFACSCALCTAASIPRQASEARISKILQYQQVLSDYTPSSGGSPQMAEKLIKLYEKENLHAARGTGHMFAAYAYNAVGNVEESKRHALEAIKVGMVGSGDQEGDIREMRKVIEKPTRHWSFGLRNARGPF